MDTLPELAFMIIGNVNAPYLTIFALELLKNLRKRFYQKLMLTAPILGKLSVNQDEETQDVFV